MNEYHVEFLLQRISELEHQVKITRNRVYRWKRRALAPQSEREEKLLAELKEAHWVNRQMHKRHSDKIRYWRRKAAKLASATEPQA